MFIRDSRRSYRTYSYAELILITDLCAFRTPVGVTELMLMLRSLNLFGGTRRYHRDYGTYTGISEHILVFRILRVLQNLYMYFKSYTCITELILVLLNLYWSYGTYTCLMELILVLQNLFLYFGYGSTRRYYRTFFWYKSTRRYYGTDSLYGGTRRYH